MLHLGRAGADGRAGGKESVQPGEQVGRLAVGFPIVNQVGRRYGAKAVGRQPKGQAVCLPFTLPTGGGQQRAQRMYYAQKPRRSPEGLNGYEKDLGFLPQRHKGILQAHYRYLNRRCSRKGSTKGEGPAS
jgi:hypothetical protein